MFDSATLSAVSQVAAAMFTFPTVVCGIVNVAVKGAAVMDAVPINVPSACATATIAEDNEFALFGARETVIVSPGANTCPGEGAETEASGTEVISFCMDILGTVVDGGYDRPCKSTCKGGNGSNAGNAGGMTTLSFGSPAGGHGNPPGAKLSAKN
jgi:hypothetical protein